MKKNILLYLILLLLCPFAFGQTDSLNYVLRGVVYEAETGKPLPGVNVSLPGSHFATVTNEDGGFIIKSDFLPSALTLIHVGYKTVNRPIVYGQTDYLEILMSKDALSLREAVLFGDPLTLLYRALEKIPVNYSAVPERFQCFYRETVQKRQRFIAISEAVMDMYKTSYNQGIGRDRVLVEKSRLLASPKVSDTLSVKVLGGPTQATELDLVKNGSFFFSQDNLELYTLRMGQAVMINDRPQYVIQMVPGGGSEYALRFTALYIDMETLAFTRIEQLLDVSDVTKATNEMLVRKPFGLRFRPREMSLVINYSYDGRISRISHVRAVFRFTCDWGKKLFRTPFTAVSEMVVTNRYEGAVTPIERTEAFKRTETLLDLAKFYFDPDFWKDYNIIEPTTSLEHAIDRIKK